MTSSALPRIVSFLPSATEMACALGLVDQLAGISHECDYPIEARNKPVVVRPVLPIETMSESEIDVAVTSRMRDGLSLYGVDEALMREIAPDLILTQDLCQVCAPSGNDVTNLLKVLPSKPRVLYMTPRSIEEIFGNMRDLGAATGREDRAAALVASWKDRLAAVAASTAGVAHRPRVFCMEWLDPVYCSGHWVPEMVEIAGGVDSLGRKGTDSVRIPWSDVVAWAPEVLVISPCGFHLERVIAEASRLFEYPGWSDLPAVRSGRVYAVDANSYFARPGPRVVDGTELLAHFCHPDRVSWRGPASAFAAVRAPAASPRR